MSTAATVGSPADLSLVVPCFRPQPGWAVRLADRFEAFAKTRPTSAVELIFVHDGTPGGLDTAELKYLCERLPGTTLIDNPSNHGKGAALRQGVTASTAPLTLYTDVDLPYTTTSMAAVAEALAAGGGVVAGERFEDYYASVPPFRRLLSRAHRYAMRKLFRLSVSDSQAGLKGFDESGKRIFLETQVDRFLVDLDFIVRCRGRVPVRAVRVQLRPDVTFTDFGLDILRREAGNFLKILGGAWRG